MERHKNVNLILVSGYGYSQHDPAKTIYLEDYLQAGTYTTYINERFIHSDGGIFPAGGTTVDQLYERLKPMNDLPYARVYL